MTGQHAGMTTPEPYLGVAQSVLGRHWQGPDGGGQRHAEALAQTTGLPPALCAVLARLGVAAEQAQNYLSPRLRDLLPDPLGLRDMGKAAARFLHAVAQRERIAIFADYDVDGGASAALLICWLRQAGISATLYVPDRITEGYGPNDAAMSMLAASHDLIICVDCGTLSHGPVATARGADVIILDHHLGGETLPEALAVVNPNRQDESGDLGHLCAAGVVFLVLVEANRQLRATGQTGPDLMAMLDLVALATVADVAPLTGVNRAFVRQGLHVLASRTRPGLRALADIARLDSAPRAYHLGFVLGPRVNAGGRIGAADLGARLLATDDPAEAQALAEKLEHLNTERREIEAAVRASAMAQAEARGVEGPLVWAAGEGWHPGVIGIVAARLKEATGRPAVVIALDGAEGKGSGRSVAGVDLGAAVQRLAAEGLLLRGGGHRMAAGLTVARDRLDAAMDRLGVLLQRQGAGTQNARALRLDGVLMAGAVTAELVAELERAGPYGPAAPAPRFAVPNMRILSHHQVGGAHLRLTLAGDSGIDSGGPGGGRLNAIAFGVCNTPLGDALKAHTGQSVHVAGQIGINTHAGRQSLQLRLDDAAPVR